MAAEPNHAAETAARADREKTVVAASSLLAAVLLTGTKLGVGLWTNSLGILSEAAHSALDLAAAGMTLWAVRAAARPADRRHAYGHGKFENLSALFETLLLLATCVWIFVEAIQRLVAGGEHVQANVWAFATVLLSIGVDVSRSRALARAARRHKSQALEADALHFSTDVWSSAVVLLGLAAVVAAPRLGAPWLVHADAAAALGVALIVVWVSVRLGRKAIDDLVDATPPRVAQRIAEMLGDVPNAVAVRRVRVRRSGPIYFVDLTLVAPADVPLSLAHAAADVAEARVRAAYANADVVVHVEPDVEPADEHDVEPS